jgi:type IV pilus assembly protein PilC
VGKLGSLGYTPVDIRAESQSAHRKIMTAAFSRIKTDDMMIFYIQLYNMVNAGINILMSLQAIEDQVQNRRLKDVIRSVADHIEGGSNFSDALAANREVFPELFINMVRSGEASGKLEVVLGSYASLYEEQIDLNQKITGALFYPLILLCMGITVITFLIIFIIPRFVSIFADSGVTLPLPTMVLNTVGTVVRHYWYLIAALIVLAWLGIRRVLSTEAGRSVFDRAVLTMPVVGPLNQNVALSRFSSTLGMLLRSGVPITKSLELTAEVVRNSVFAKVISGAARSIEKGENLTRTLRASGKFPANIIQMVSVGEDTGNLDGMLEKAGIFYGKAVAGTIKKLTIVIEPLFLIVMGSAVGFIMASILLPLFRMISIIKM